MVKSGRGRPKVEQPQLRRSIRLTDQVWWQVERAASRSGLTIADWLRKAIEAALSQRDRQ